MDAMQCEYDPERLIDEVKKRPGIWDFDDPNYRSKQGRHRLWNEIVKELVQGQMKISKSEMRELELQLQKKWKSIRDCFQKQLQRSNTTKRPYVYTKQLQFLLKNQYASRSNQNQNGSQKEAESSESDDGTKSRRLWKPKKVLTLVKNEDSSEENSNDNLDDTVYYSNDGVDASPAKVARTNKPIDEFAFASVDIKNDGDDPDKMFLISLLPHLKAIPEEFRLDAKMDMMQVLRNVKYTNPMNHKNIII